MAAGGTTLDAHDGGAATGGTTSGGGAGATSLGGSGGGAADGGAADGSPGSAGPQACPTAAVPPTALRRLNNFEYDNTVRDLFADSSRPAAALWPDVSTPDSIQEQMLPPSAVVVEGYHDLAHKFALTVTKDPATVTAFTACDAAVQGESVCRRQFIENVVARVFRRPVVADDVADLDAVFATGIRLGGNYGSGVRAVVEVALQSPEFLYRVEFGESVADKPAAWARPTPHEMATRLSYLLWGSTPDAALLDAANKGGLRSKAEIATQARRMLADPRAHDVVRAFYFRLLPLSTLNSATVPGGTGLTPNLAALMEKETEAFIDDVTWKAPGDLRSLLTAPFTWVNGPLAAYYGIAGITGDAFQRVDLNKAQRAGLLTQGSFLTATSTPNSTNPVRRGLAVYNRILCGEILPEPADVVVAISDPLTGPVTTRQRFEQHSSDPSCATCHKNMDPIGFAFEHYGPTGLWRDTENGLKIDATGEIFTTDARGKFDGAIQLAEQLAKSQDVKNCFVGQWLTFANGRPDIVEDACSRQFLQDAFAKANGNIPELLFALTQTDDFLYRPASEVKP